MRKNEAMNFAEEEALSFGYWLVNAPKKEIYSKRWIEIKYSEWVKQLRPEPKKEGVK